MKLCSDQGKSKKSIFSQTKGIGFSTQGKWSSLFDDFSIHLIEECENELTVKGYLNDVSKFLNYIECGLNDLLEVDPLVMGNYLKYLETENYTGHSIARQLSALRNFFKYLRNKGLMTVNPMDNMKQPKLSPKKNIITETVFLEMEVYVKNHSNEKTRDLIMLYLLYYDKIKLSEIVKIKKNDISNSLLIINGTSNTLHSKTRELLNRQFTNSKTEFLLHNAHNKPLTASGAYYVLKNIFTHVGMPDLRPIDLTKKKAQ
jgi:site-specific recombinase XerD